jgi:hypothetical protein
MPYFLLPLGTACNAIKFSIIKKINFTIQPKIVRCYSLIMLMFAELFLIAESYTVNHLKEHNPRNIFKRDSFASQGGAIGWFFIE